MIDERVTPSLDSMKRAATEAISFVADMTEADFLKSTTTQMASAMCLILIGEAATRIEKRSPDFVAGHPDWPWNKIRGLRNLIVHDYEGLDMLRVLVVIKESLPDLLAKIDALGELDPRMWPKP